MENLFETYGFDLKKVIEDAKANGNEKFAEVLEKQVANLQTCYDLIAQRHSSTGGENVWNIDGEYLQTLLK